MMEWIYISLVMLASWLWWCRSRTDMKLKMPPGPEGWPVVGNLFQLSTKVPTQRVMQNLASKYGPIMSLRMGRAHVVVISSCSMALDFFKNNDAVFCNRPNILVGRVLFYGFKGVALTPFGDHWRQVRKVCISELIAPKRVASFRGIREAEADIMVQDITSKSGSVVDVSKALSTLMSNISWLLMVGKKFDDDKLVAEDITFKKLLDEISVAASLGNIGDYLPFLGWMERVFPMTRRLKFLNSVFDRFIHSVLEERERDPNRAKYKDFVGVLMNHPSFERDHVKAIVLDMFIAGTETAATTAEWMMSLILKNPRTLKKAQEEVDRVVGRESKVREEHLGELKYLQCMMKETMRLYPTVPLIGPHMAMKDAVVCGYRVPKGAITFINSWALGRDSNVWEDAEQFMPERFMNEDNVDITGLKDQEVKMIPFRLGPLGRRGCPGAPVVVPVVLLGIATLLHNFDWKVHAEINMTEKFGLSIPRKFPLFASPSPRLP